MNQLKNVPKVSTIDIPNNIMLFNATTCFLCHLFIISRARKVDPINIYNQERERELWLLRRTATDTKHTWRNHNSPTMDGTANIFPSMRYDFQISSLGIPNAVEGIVVDMLLLS